MIGLAISSVSVVPMPEVNSSPRKLTAPRGLFETVSYYVPLHSAGSCLEMDHFGGAHRGPLSLHNRARPNSPPEVATKKTVKLPRPHAYHTLGVMHDRSQTTLVPLSDSTGKPNSGFAAPLDEH
ncbi:hypothetical protein A8D89_32045 [Burkholderia cenocepacia]|nr:hypothetical protein A8D89_32045 [Burkholderia cenocepacia]